MEPGRKVGRTKQRFPQSFATAPFFAELAVGSLLLRRSARGRSELRAGVDPELLVDPGQGDFDRLDAQDEFRRDLTVGMAARDQRGDALLGRRQGVAGSRGVDLVAAQALADVCDRPAT